MTTVAPMNDADVLPLTNPPIKVKVAALENLIKVKNATPVYIYLVSVLGVVMLGLGAVLGLELGLGLDLGLGVGVVFGIKSDPVPVCTCAGGVAASGAACTSAAAKCTTCDAGLKRHSLRGLRRSSLRFVQRELYGRCMRRRLRTQRRQQRVHCRRWSQHHYL